MHLRKYQNLETKELVESAIQCYMDIQKLENKKEAASGKEFYQLSEISDIVERKYIYVIDIINKRATETEFNHAAALLNATDTDDIKKTVGIDILARLPYYENLFQSNVIDLLLHFLQPSIIDSQSIHVLNSVLVALSYLIDNDHTDLLPLFIKISEHEHFKIRYPIVLILSNYSHEDAIQCLAKLCYDDSSIVREWAVFSLGSYEDQESSLIKETLHDCLLNDTNVDVRGEALIGLAEKNDNRIIENIKTLLNQQNKDSEINPECLYAIRACEILADHDFLTYLQPLKQNTNLNLSPYDLECLADAIDACESSIPN